MRSTLRQLRQSPIPGTILAFLLSSAPAWAQGRPIPVEDMARQAEVIGVASVDSARSHDEPRTGFINTDFHLTFSEVWKGDAGSNFILIKPGGEVPGRKAAVPGHEFEMKLGEKVVVFATPSSLGNHVIIGLRQGLYRVGGGENPPLYRVSEFPFGPGKDSTLTLQDLKNQVYTALGKPVETKPAPKGTEPAPPPEKKTESPAPAPSSDNIASPHASAGASESSQRWIGGVVVCVFLAALIAVIFWKRKAKTSG